MFHEDLGEHVLIKTAFQVVLMVKNRLPMQETQVRSLGGEDALEEKMATHSGIPAWRIPWTEEPGRLQSMGLQESRLSNLTTTDYYYLSLPKLPISLYYLFHLGVH